MYDPNHMNSLYFYPHKLHFSPQLDAADSEQRNRWFPGYNASTSPKRAKAPAVKSESIPAADSQNSDQERPAVDEVHVDDNSAPPTKGDQD